MFSGYNADGQVTGASTTEAYNAVGQVVQETDLVDSGGLASVVLQQKVGCYRSAT
jgi:hypothetical protein